MVRHRHQPGVVDRTWVDVTEVLRPDGEVVRLEGAASLVWTVLDQPGSAAEVGDRIALARGVPAEREAVDQVLGDLTGRGLLVPVQEG